MGLGERNFRRVVHGNAGGFCFSLNSLFSSLLRYYNFTTSEVGARVYLKRGQNAEEVGYAWSAVTHSVLLVSWEGSGQRYLVDAGFGGGGNPLPMILQHGETSASLLENEAFLLRRQTLPGSEADVSLIDRPDGYILYRRVTKDRIEDHTKADSTSGFYTPMYRK